MIGDIIEMERARQAMGEVEIVPVRDNAGDRISSREIDIGRTVDQVAAGAGHRGPGLATPGLAGWAPLLVSRLGSFADLLGLGGS
jgi:hypothetical protein